MYIVIYNKVYDVSNFIHKHPGGSLVLKHYVNEEKQIKERKNIKDATEVFISFHPKKAYSILKNYYKYDINKLKLNKSQIEYRKLHEKLISKDMFKPNRMFYFKEWAKLSTIFLFFLTSYFYNYYLISAVILSLFWHQTLLYSHTSCHNEVTGDSFFDSKIAGVILTFLVGVSCDWWKDNHNTHHVVTNSVEDDPDIQHLPFIAVDKIILESFYSTYYKVNFINNPLTKFIIKYQNVTFYPLMLVGRFNMYRLSAIHHIKNKRFNWIFFSFLNFFIVYSYLVCYIKGNYNRLLFVLISNCLVSILHLQICLSHFSCKVYKGFNNNWVEKNCTGSLNIKSSKWLEWFHGGLNYQVEHHLFPRLPQHNLPLIVNDVKELCKSCDIEYNCVDFFSANKLLYKTLLEVNR